MIAEKRIGKLNNFLKVLYQLLRNKGYTGPFDWRFINEWLQSMDIKITFYETFVKNENRGVIGELSIPPHSSRFTSDEFFNIEDAATHLLYQFIDFIPTKIN